MCTWVWSEVNPLTREQRLRKIMRTPLPILALRPPPHNSVFFLAAIQYHSKVQVLLSCRYDVQGFNCAKSALPPLRMSFLQSSVITVTAGSISAPLAVGRRGTKQRPPRYDSSVRCSTRSLVSLWKNVSALPHSLLKVHIVRLPQRELG